MCIEAAPVVCDGDVDVFIALFDGDMGVLCLGMASHVGECFAHNVQDLCLCGWGEGGGDIFGDVEFDGYVGGGAVFGDEVVKLAAEIGGGGKRFAQAGECAAHVAVCGADGGFHACQFVLGVGDTASGGQVAYAVDGEVEVAKCLGEVVVQVGGEAFAFGEGGGLFSLLSSSFG